MGESLGLSVTLHSRLGLARLYTVRKTGGANATQAAHAPWRDPRQTETTDGPSSPSALLGDSYLTILRHLAAY